MIFSTIYSSPLGTITLASDGKNLLGAWLEAQKHFGGDLDLSAAVRDSNLKIFSQTREWLDVYFDGREPTFTPSLAPRGSKFQRRVWEILRSIPYGKTSTYGQIAAKIAQENGLDKMSARAVGAAVGRNPISIIIPCHRVLGANGALTGYAGGPKRKTALLTLEKLNFQI